LVDDPSVTCIYKYSLSLSLHNLAESWQSEVALLYI
ncbi:hypothetical protein THAOC_23293, partial [Thalassiosira oceanica]